MRSVSLHGLRGVPGVRRVRSWLTRLLTRPLQRNTDARHYRAAILKIDRIGDFVLALSTIRLALAHYGEAQCFLVVSPQVEPLAAMEFPLTPRLLLPASVGHKELLWAGMRARRLLAGYRCAELVCLRHQRWDWDELVLQWLAADRSHLLCDETSLGYYRDRNTHPRLTPTWPVTAPFALTERLPVGVTACRDLLLHRQLLSSVIGREVSVEEVLPRFVRVRNERASGGIGVSPFSSAAIKDFPEVQLMQALHELRKLTAEPIWLWGGADQQQRLLGLAERLRHNGLNDVACAPTVTITEFVAQVAAARFVLTADTATAHIATALDLPTLVLIGGGHHGQFGPWRKSTHQVWLTHPMDCFGCSWECVHPEPYCLTRIAADELRSVVTQLWSKGARP